MITVLIADDEAAARHGIKKALARLNCRLLEAADGHAALDLIQREQPDLVLLDIHMPGRDGLSVLSTLGDQTSSEIVMVTADDRLESAIECMRLGASDYLTKPYEIERLRAFVRRTIKRVATEREVQDLRQQLSQQNAFGALIGVSRAMRELFLKLPKAAAAPLDILIRGETGTGKELIAREIHRLSTRSDGPFIALNTAAISETLAESQLFGHVKGAFTGANKNHIGVFQQADGGTLFLDEIGDMPPALQAKVLRVLQEREVQPVGANRSVNIDVRVLSATHQDLSIALEQGEFREDLYYRLRGIELYAPALRQRPEDIPLLANFFLTQLAERSQSESKSLSPDAMRRLLDYHWPGNVRELQQVITAAGAMALGERIETEDINLRGSTSLTQQTDWPQLDGLPLTEAKAQLTEWFERRTIQQVLSAHEGNISAAARQLGLHRQSLQQKLAQLGISAR